MLGLYEATDLRVHGEDILDEAHEFIGSRLAAIATQLSPRLAAQVTYTLSKPVHKGVPRLEARHYMSTYHQDDLHNEALLKLAKLDFNLLQKLHQKELCHITKWWKDLDIATKLPFARDRLVECYFWILGVHSEPQYAFNRKILTKVIAMASVMDDIYDVYGTFEELQLYTEAIERFYWFNSLIPMYTNLSCFSKILIIGNYIIFRWDIDAIDKLPDFMKVHYRGLLDIYYEIEEEMAKQGKTYRVKYAKEAVGHMMKRLARGYLAEAKWLHENYVPQMEEYMRVALVSSGYPMLVAMSFVCMGDIVTKESFDWVFSDPKIVRASSIIARLMDDIVSHKFEQNREHVASAIECYMKQFGGSEKEAIEELNRQVTNAWKDINEECLNPTSVPMPLIVPALNFSRVIALIYKDEDGYTHAASVLKDSVASLLIDSVPL